MFSIYDIKTEYLTNPLGMDEPKPRFSYKLKGECEKQAERRIIVKAENGCIAWDSGFVAIQFKSTTREKLLIHLLATQSLLR